MDAALSEYASKAALSGGSDGNVGDGRAEGAGLAWAGQRWLKKGRLGDQTSVDGAGGSQLSLAAVQ